MLKQIGEKTAAPRKHYSFYNRESPKVDCFSIGGKHFSNQTLKQRFFLPKKGLRFSFSARLPDSYAFSGWQPRNVSAWGVGTKKRLMCHLLGGLPWEIRGFVEDNMRVCREH